MPSVRPLLKYRKGTFGLLRGIVFKAVQASRPSMHLVRRRMKIRQRGFYPNWFSRF